MAEFLYGHVYYHDRFAGLLRQEPGDRCSFLYDGEFLRPVSYTHLDVYKRQMGAQPGWQETQVRPALYRHYDILPRQFAGQDIGKSLPRGKPELRVEAGAAQIGIYN